LADSDEATAEKAQQDPHCPWFLTTWTAPLVTQLTEAAATGVSSTAETYDLAL